MTTHAQLRTRSRKAAGWSLERTPSRVLGRHWGVHPSRARHRRHDGDNCVTDTLALIRDPLVDGPAIVAVVLEAFEDRCLAECGADRARLEARLRHLTHEAEHLAQAKQDRALMVGEGVFDAALHHASVLLEIVTLRLALGAD